jgi:hypothetical protein
MGSAGRGAVACSALTANLDIHVAREQVVQAGPRGTQQKALLRAGAPSGPRIVEWTHRIKAPAPEVNAGSVTKRDDGRAARIGTTKKQVEGRHGKALRDGVTRIHAWIPRDTRPAGKRNDCTHLGAAFGVSSETIEPIIGNLGVLMHDNEVAIAMQQSGAADRGGKTLWRRLREQGDEPTLCHRPEHPGKRRLRTRVVNDDQIEGCLLRRGEYAVQACAHADGVTPYRDDHVDACHEPPAPVKDDRSRCIGQRTMVSNEMTRSTFASASGRRALKGFSD